MNPRDNSRVGAGTLTECNTRATELEKTPLTGSHTENVEPTKRSTPDDTLCDDVLAIVFETCYARSELVTGGGLPFELIAWHVSRHWRTLARNLSSLWASGFARLKTWALAYVRHSHRFLLHYVGDTRTFARSIRSEFCRS